ncbi:sulfatase-like hydrolase/transferase [Cellvibrio sp. OA-2007]|uniref:sulfatase-like hydrolase/transferase n=1 Tax=Cellvibrio sp. OA-2007 TaxID=529823 RepID=UPI0007812DEC|nr:sulfatase-like hydrolase/transferase [Cellvibrio sp. OA-2007]
MHKNQRNSIHNYLSYLGLALLICSAWACYGAELAKPNIVFILSDDAGYADFGFQGSTEIPTPNLDQLAQEGVVFKQAYVSASVCGPSRAGLLTGKYPQRFGFEENNVPGYMSSSGATGDDMGMRLDQLTMANYLAERGYRTSLIGKWHQGNEDRFHPLKRGFDEFFGFRGGARSYFPFTQAHPSSRREDFLERNFNNYGESLLYLTDALANETIEFIKRNKHQPFFTFLSLSAPHYPMEAEKSDLDQFPHLTGERKIYAAMMLNMDRAIGRVLQTLQQEGLSENTLVIFTNDNGGPSDHNGSINLPLSGTKANLLEGGIRVPMIMRWPGVTKPGSSYDPMVSTLDLLPTFYAAAGGDVRQVTDWDGVDLKPFLQGKNSQSPHKNLFWREGPIAALRQGDWKLLRFPDRPAELYNIATDPSELTDLALQNPAKVSQLYRQLFAWELTLDRPAWQLKPEFLGAVIKRMDDYWHKPE